MSDEDKRDWIIEQLEASLPEFFDRNHIRVTGEDIARLAYWITGSFPACVARVNCSGSFAAIGNVECACPGTCQKWLSVAEPEEHT